jgi:prepilin-type processing-associated H-X9-DG protein
VTWTKPEEIEFDPAKPLPKLELPGGLKQIGVLFTDGHVRRIDLNRWDEKALKAYIGAADGIWVDDPDASPAPRAVPKAAPPVESKEQSRPAAPGAAKP